jgi:diaminohydroxyphosphoribosylaminopyrimidine deaminase / 5-amino-6-(5-phosphoribosylamino)uracil reductase
MARAVELALRAEGRTSPNPIVGAVVVDASGKVVGEGWHQRAGEPHAEVYAFDAAGTAARGGTLYVSLEPCCHHGKTPPCSDRVIASGVKRVVCGLQDPNPKVAGGGIEALRAAGIEVEVGVLEEACREANRAWLKWIGEEEGHRLPWVALKLAATLDGKIADREGRSKWITGEQARNFVHELRNRFDCVLIGANTAVLDDPLLTVRNIEDRRDPIRCIVDAQLRLPATSRLAQNPDGKTWVFASEGAILRGGASYGASVKLIETPFSMPNQLDVMWILKYLGAQRKLSVLCEGGGKLAASLLASTDEIYWIAAPKIMSDNQAIPVINSELPSDISLVTPHTVREVRQLGNDVLIRLRL